VIAGEVGVEQVAEHALTTVKGRNKVGSRYVDC